MAWPLNTRPWAAALLAAGVAGMAQPTPEYQAKILLMDKLVRFVDWPPRADLKSGFVLAVLGRSPFGDELDAYYAAHTVKDHPVTIRYLRQLSELGECHLLFICASEKPRLGGILAQLKGRPILTLADTEGFAGSGVMVGLVRSEARIVFEVNPVAARDAGFRMAPGFLQLARIVP